MSWNQIDWDVVKPKVKEKKLDSLEDRIFAAGKHVQFSRALGKFKNSKHTKDDQQAFYDKLEDLGASSEESDEFVNMVMADYE